MSKVANTLRRPSVLIETPGTINVGLPRVFVRPGTPRPLLGYFSSRPGYLSGGAYRYL